MNKTWVIVGWAISWVALSLLWAGLVVLAYVVRNFYSGDEIYHLGSYLSDAILWLATYPSLLAGLSLIGILLLLTYYKSHSSLWIIWAGVMAIVLLALLYGGAVILSLYCVC